MDTVRRVYSSLHAEGLIESTDQNIEETARWLNAAYKRHIK
jgi:DNA-binding transcriptional regulator YhcF (GntR family)